VTPEILALGRSAWEAFCAPEPTELEQLLEKDTSPLPFLGPAIRRLLEELPNPETGLSRTERQLLEPLLDGPRTPPQLFLESQAREEAVFAGDAWVWKLLGELGPLVSDAEGEALPPPPPLGDPQTFAATRVTLSGTGRDVLAGKAERAVAGIDRWLGGTHLGIGPDWRWDPDPGSVRLKTP
jgi:hypothetical protein